MSKGKTTSGVLDGSLDSVSASNISLPDLYFLLLNHKVAILIIFFEGGERL